MPLAKHEISDQVMRNAHLGRFGTFMIGGELRLLPDLLLDGEAILAVTRGRVDATTWVMAVTDSRVLLVNKGLLFGFRHLEVPLDQVKSASSRTGLFSGAIFIDTGGGTVVLEGISKKATAEVAAVLSQVINAHYRKEPPAPIDAKDARQLKAIPRGSASGTSLRKAADKPAEKAAPRG